MMLCQKCKGQLDDRLRIRDREAFTRLFASDAIWLWMKAIRTESHRGYSPKNTVSLVALFNGKTAVGEKNNIVPLVTVKES